MSHTLSDPVNLLDEIDGINEYSSGSCLRRTMARILGHSGLDLAEAREFWLEIGYPRDNWSDCIRMIEAM